MIHRNQCKDDTMRLQSSLPGYSHKQCSTWATRGWQLPHQQELLFDLNRLVIRWITELHRHSRLKLYINLNSVTSLLHKPVSRNELLKNIFVICDFSYKLWVKSRAMFVAFLLIYCTSERNSWVKVQQNTHAHTRPQTSDLLLFSPWQDIQF